MPASSTMQKSHLAPKSSPKEVSRDMSAIESMIVAINKTTDNISSLQRNHDQREALHDSRYHESQKSFMESQKSFYESQKSVQGIMTNMMERLDDLHRHIESVENKFSPIDSTSKTFSSGNLESPHLDLPQEASKPSPSSVQISQSPLLLSQVGMKPEQDVTKMPNLQDINLDTTLPSDVDKSKSSHGSALKNQSSPSDKSALAPILEDHSSLNLPRDQSHASPTSYVTAASYESTQVSQPKETVIQAYPENYSSVSADRSIQIQNKIKNKNKNKNTRPILNDTDTLSVYDSSPTPSITVPVTVPIFSPKPVVVFNINKWSKEIKDLTLKSDTFDAVLSWYDHILQCLVIATSRTDIIPELEDLTIDFSFENHILPPSTSSVYKSAMFEYKSMSRALRIYIHKEDTISSTCTNLLETRDVNKNVRDGFILLKEMLQTIFPHLGGPHVDVVKEISSLTLRKNDTLESLLHTFNNLERKLLISKQVVPSTALLVRYTDILKEHPQVFTIISPILRMLHDHMISLGPDIKFHHYTIHQIHKYIKRSGFKVDTTFVVPNAKYNQRNVTNLHAAATSLDLVPVSNCDSQACRQIVLHGQPSTDINNISSQANAVQLSRKSSSRSSRCPMCFQRHSPTRCWARNKKFQPTWLKRNIAKYDALHPNDEPDETYIDQSPPLRSAQVNKVSFLVDPERATNQSDSDTISSHDDSTITLFHHEPSVTQVELENPIIEMDSTIIPTSNMVKSHPNQYESSTDESFIEA